MWPFPPAYPVLTVDDLANQTFDYIVVGGGTAGCAVAARLSDPPPPPPPSPGTSSPTDPPPPPTVLLLERGPVSDTLLSRVPLLSSAGTGGGIVVSRHAEPDPASHGGKPARVYHAEALGGTSRINSLLWTRGSVGMYERWGREVSGGGGGDDDDGEDEEEGDGNGQVASREEEEKQDHHENQQARKRRERKMPGWAWKDVEPYFLRLEDAQGHPSSPHRGHGGPVITTRHHRPLSHSSNNNNNNENGSSGSKSTPGLLPLHAHMEAAAAAAGLPIGDDANDPAAPAQGYFYTDYTVDGAGRRHSAMDAYLPRGAAVERKKRGTLAVCTGAVAARVLVDGGGGGGDGEEEEEDKEGEGGRRIEKQTLRRATGVYVRKAKSTTTTTTTDDDILVRARREVILCGGAICSPQLLQLSGIGPAPQLRRHGIPVIKDLPAVGRNLSDHHGIPVGIELPARQTLHRLEFDWLWALWQLVLYFFGCTGSWMGTTTTSSTVFANTKHLDRETAQVVRYQGRGGQSEQGEEEEKEQEQDDYMDATLPRNIPDLEIMVIPANAALEHHPGRSLMTLYTVLIQPQSLGTLEIASADPAHHPVIKFNHFSDAHGADLEAARRGVRFALRIAEEFVVGSGWPYKGESRLGLAPERMLQKGQRGGGGGGGGAGDWPDWRELEDGELDDFARDNVQSALHLGCTCRMSAAKGEGEGEGHGGDGKGGVVGPDLKVHGFANLRVADASVFPFIPAAHTMAPTYMVAERCADFVKGDWEGV